MMMCSLYFSEQCIVKIFKAPSIFLPGMATEDMNKTGSFAILLTLSLYKVPNFANTIIFMCNANRKLKLSKLGPSGLRSWSSVSWRRRAEWRRRRRLRARGSSRSRLSTTTDWLRERSGIRGRKTNMRVNLYSRKFIKYIDHTSVFHDSRSWVL